MALKRYDKDEDYQKLINEAEASGDTASAKLYEQLRNEKIQGEGITTQSKTYKYNTDPNTDYSQIISGLISSGSDPTLVQDAMNKRQDKISQNPSLSKFSNDSVMQAAQAYIDRFTVPDYSFEQERPSYESKYAEAIDSLLSQLQNWTYGDFLQTDDYGALQNNYTEAGARAMEDTLGQISARTGGLASSYATIAASQENNRYMEALDAAAREMYADKRSDLYNQLSLLQGLESMEYGKYADSLN